MPESANSESLSSCFYQGKYKNVVLKLGRSPLQHLATESINSYQQKTCYQIGALSFLGDFNEARAIYEQAVRCSDFKLNYHCQARFFLGIGCIRRSDYKEGITYFAKNQLSRRHVKNYRKTELTDPYAIQEIEFYALQGSAFFSFFRGRFLKAKNVTEHAYRLALDMQFNYGQVLTLDLLGHARCQLGDITRGLYELAKAQGLARDLGNGGLVAAISISLVKYRSQFGLNIPTALAELKQALATLAVADTYSRAEIYLEIIRQLTLRGKCKSAQHYLELAGHLVYQHQSKRQSAVYNLRYAHLHLLRGEAHAALALTQALRNNLDSKIDIVISNQADGLATKIKLHLGIAPQDLISKNQSTHIIDARIKSRYSNEKIQNYNRGEDPMGDLIDRVHANGIAEFYELKKLGLYGLIPQLLNIKPGSTGVYLGPSRGEVVIVNHGDVVCIDQGVTSPIKKLITALVGPGYKKKENLVRLIWNYDYNPAVHDNLLHATIGKLRKILGEFGSWVEWSDNGYKLSDHIQIFKMEPDVSLRNQSTSYIVPSATIDINMRQIKVLASFKQGQFMTVKQYSKRYNVTTMTAFRDLSTLQSIGRVLRVGRGRATAYCLP